MVIYDILLKFFKVNFICTMTTWFQKLLMTSRLYQNIIKHVEKMKILEALVIKKKQQVLNQILFTTARTAFKACIKYFKSILNNYNTYEIFNILVTDFVKLCEIVLYIMSLI